jgi:ferredoxin
MRTACATCEDACPFKAIEVNEMSFVNWEACMGYEVCVGQCPNKAMSLVRDQRKTEIAILRCGHRAGIIGTESDGDDFAETMADGGHRLLPRSSRLIPGRYWRS